MCIHIMVNSHKKTEVTQSFQNTLAWVQRLLSPFPFKQSTEPLAALCNRPAVSFGLPFVLASEWGFCRMSEQHGRQPSLSVGLPILTPPSTCPHWSMAGNVTERTMEKGPLSSHSSPADPPTNARPTNPLGVSVAFYLQTHRRTHPNGPCQLLHSVFPSPPSRLFTSEFIRGGYPRRKCLSPEGGADTLYLFPLYF